MIITHKTSESQDRIIELYKKHGRKAEQRTQQITAAYMKMYQETGAEYYLRKYNNVAECHNYAVFRQYYDPDNTLQLKKLNRCKHSLCSFCNWVNSKKEYSILAAAMVMLKEEGHKLRHLVITVPNCSAEELHQQLTILHKIAAELMRHYKVGGYYRATEITYKKEDNTYHPHCHILITDFINIYDITHYSALLYKKYVPTYNKNTTIAWISKCNYIKELCKYITKPNDFNTKQIYDLIKNDSLYNIRKSSCGGIIAEARKKAKILIKANTAAINAELSLYGYTDILYNLYTGLPI